MEEKVFYEIVLRSFDIKAISYTSETDFFFVLPNGKRCKKGYTVYVFTSKNKQECIDFCRSFINKEIEKAKRQLKYAEDKLERFNKKYNGN